MKIHKLAKWPQWARGPRQLLPQLGRPSLHWPGATPGPLPSLHDLLGPFQRLSFQPLIQYGCFGLPVPQLDTQHLTIIPTQTLLPGALENLSVLGLGWELFLCFKCLLCSWLIQPNQEHPSPKILPKPAATRSSPSPKALSKQRPSSPCTLVTFPGHVACFLC